MREGCVRLEGTEPFYLRAVEHATASALDQTVQITLYALVEGRGSTPVPIQTQMTLHAAQELADSLLRAAHDAQF